MKTRPIHCHKNQPPTHAAQNPRRAITILPNYCSRSVRSTEKLRSSLKNSRNSLVYFTGTATVNKEMHSNIFRRLKDAARRKCHEKWPSRQCSSTPAGFGQGCLSEEQCDSTRSSFILITYSHISKPAVLNIVNRTQILC